MTSGSLSKVWGFYRRQGRMPDEARDHVIRIVGVADRVGAAEEHLKTDVRHAGAKLVQPVPGGKIAHEAR